MHFRGAAFILYIGNQQELYSIYTGTIIITNLPTNYYCIVKTVTCASPSPLLHVCSKDCNSSLDLDFSSVLLTTYVVVIIMLYLE
jgi:hypothetical protein